MQNKFIVWAMVIGLLVMIVSPVVAEVFVQPDIRSIDIQFSPKRKAFPIQLNDSEWKARLSNFEYKVLRHEATERAFSGAHDSEERAGIYYSRATGQPLFSSDHKYDSGTGWPSFWRPITLDAVEYIEDRTFFGRRVEIVDSSSGSHLGHIFKDGPAPTNLRFCINSAALIFVPHGEAPPQIVSGYLANHDS